MFFALGLINAIAAFVSFLVRILADLDAELKLPLLIGIITFTVNAFVFFKHHLNQQQLDALSATVERIRKQQNQSNKQ